MPLWICGRVKSPLSRRVSRSNFAPCGRRPDEQAISLSGRPDSSAPSDGASFLWAGDQELAERWSSHWIIWMTRPPSQTERHPCRSLHSLPQALRFLLPAVPPCFSCCNQPARSLPATSLPTARPLSAARTANSTLCGCVCQVISPCVSRRCAVCAVSGWAIKTSSPALSLPHPLPLYSLSHPTRTATQQHLQQHRQQTRQTPRPRRPRRRQTHPAPSSTILSSDGLAEGE